MNQQTTFKSLQVITAVSANLLFPGAGFVLVGYYQRAFQVQALLLLFTLLICWSRWVFTPAGSQTLFVILITIYIFNTLLLLIHISKNKKSAWRYKQSLYAVLFIITGYSLLLGGFMTKQYWLGVHVYVVPSQSMQPSLKTGDYILVDSWQYLTAPPQINDIVIFTRTNQKHFFVKRVGKWDKQPEQSADLLYVLGDNAAMSIDSRAFGPIQVSNIRGQVKMILFGFNAIGKIRKNRVFLPVNNQPKQPNQPS
ncbi:S26 family signal peptidase [Psychromonas aquimarina]|uniref:S26 family signal peptidase n=1 Tax=Psychromonas aquimarina TaxID=444919 RepID=UPI0003FC8B3E|nr:S26 family signal peptidase [Psychromonas aquimarina]